MRRPALAIAAALLLALTAACGDSDSGSGAAVPEVSGAAGKEPKVSVPDGDPGDKLVTETVIEGDGPEVKKGELLVAQYVGMTWRDGKTFDSSWEREQPVGFAIGVGEVIPGWDEGLVGTKVGSRVTLVIPPDKGYGEQGNPDAGIKGDDTLVFVVDVLGAHAGAEAADGRAVGDGGGDLPTVTAKKDAQPEVSIPKSDPPKKLVAETLVQGDGPAVEAGDLLVAQYVGKTWRDGKTFDSSWERGRPIGLPIGQGQVMAGWDEGLVGVKEGSRVLLVIPPDKGYGEQGNPNAGIKGDDTLVFVVDVLATY